MPLRLPASAHESHSWRIHELTPDFELEDVWALPTPGDADDFHRLIESFAGWGPSKSASLPVRGLFALRWKLGELFGWDKPRTGLGSRGPNPRGRPAGDPRGTPAPAV